MAGAGNRPLRDLSQEASLDERRIQRRADDSQLLGVTVGPDAPLGHEPTFDGPAAGRPDGAVVEVRRSRFEEVVVDAAIGQRRGGPQRLFVVVDRTLDWAMTGKRRIGRNAHLQTVHLDRRYAAGICRSWRDR